MEQKEKSLSLYDLSQEQLDIERALEDAGGELTPELEEALGNNAEALSHKIDSYSAILRKNEYMNEAIDAEIKRLQALKKTNTNKVKSLKSYIGYVMGTFGITKIDGNLCKVSKRKTTAVEIYDEDTLCRDTFAEVERLQETFPAWIRLDFTISKTELKKAIEEGNPVAGARIVENESVIIK